MSDRKRIEKILVPVDFSPGSHAALEVATALGGVLDLVHVWEPPDFADPDVMPGSVGSQGALARSEEAEARRHLEEFAAAERERGIEIGSVRVLHGRVDSTITELAEKEGYDLVVMGTKGHSGLRHLLLGSVAEKVVRHSNVPVLTVRMPKA